MTEQMDAASLTPLDDDYFPNVVSLLENMNTIVARCDAMLTVIQQQEQRIAELESKVRELETVPYEIIYMDGEWIIRDCN